MGSLELAFRNVLRNRWRSGLTLGGIAVAVALLIWTNAMMDAFMGQMVRGAVAVQMGHVQAVHDRYADEPSLFHALQMDSERTDRARAVPGVVGVSPRILAFGLVGHEQRSTVARIIGVEGPREVEISRLDQGLVAGRWLSANPKPPPGPREAVIGKGLAALMEVGPGDELVVFLQGADGSLGNDVLRIEGIVSTGSSFLDRAAVYVPLADAQWLTALDGKVHEVAMLLEDEADPRSLVAPLRAALGPTPSLSLRPWQDVMPTIAQMVEFMDAYAYVLYAIIGFIAAFGILNTQRMAVLERRREMGVLLAIGVTPGRMRRLVVLETLCLTGLGALAGVALGAALTWLHHTQGFDMAAMSSGDMQGYSYMGVTFDRILYFPFDVRDMVGPVVAMMVAGLLSALWPAVSAGRLDAIRAISGRA